MTAIEVFRRCDFSRLFRGDENSFSRNLPPIQREIRLSLQKMSGEMKTLPSTVDAGLSVWAAHAGGQMLEVTDRIPQKAVGAIGSAGDDPREGGVWQWPVLQDWIVFGKIRRKCLVELKDGLGGLSLHPVCLGETECIEIESSSAIRTVASGLSGIVVWQMWAGSNHVEDRIKLRCAISNEKHLARPWRNRNPPPI